MPERFNVKQPATEGRQAGTAIEVIEQVVNLLPQFFQRSPQVSRHGVLVGFVFGSDRHFFCGIAHLSVLLFR
jgi:hypothetical protein